MTLQQKLEALLRIRDEMRFARVCASTAYQHGDRDELAFLVRTVRTLGDEADEIADSVRDGNSGT